MLPICLVIVTFIYALAGISAFIVFIILENPAAATWAFVTGLISAFATHLRWLKYRNKLDDWYLEEHLTPMRFVGFSCFTLAVAGFVYHLVIELQGKIPIVPVDESQVIAMVWAFMTAKSGILLMFAAQPGGNIPLTVRPSERSALLVDT